ncbi:hypothetical protein G4Y79_05560 [Phototrophicus methaneseepsis]|uniref:Uncharacterized protein n=1 Tax=Phototrophicus methaneseepsis TaxID=2710758 RepID=A0A7S8IFQ4_9CHLR|nr:hypothetical protein [Phototrophicus methaneseepsis]QPC83847.1 hypothetical protein G4Y79_05560 [Phototrophicus methaneseepsis]
MSDVYEPPPMDYENLESPPDFYMDDPWECRWIMLMIRDRISMPFHHRIMIFFRFWMITHRMI